MIPGPLVALMIASMTILHRFQLAQSVSTAASASFTAGAAAGVGVVNPGVVPFVITLPLRLLNAPFYYLLGGRAADQRLKVLELAASHMNEAPITWLRILKEKVLRFDGLEVRFSEEYISKLKEQFSGLATSSSSSSSVQGRILMTNPCPHENSPRPASA